MSEIYLKQIKKRLSGLKEATPVLLKSARSSRLLTKLSRGSTAFLGFAVAIIGLWNAIQPSKELSGLSASIGVMITYVNTQFDPTNARARVVRVNTLIDDIKQFTEQIDLRMQVEAEQLKDEACAKKLFEEVQEKEDKFRDRIREITTRDL